MSLHWRDALAGSPRHSFVGEVMPLITPTAKTWPSLFKAKTGPPESPFPTTLSPDGCTVREIPS